MPTAPKFVAALIFAFVAWFASNLVVPYLPNATRVGWLHEISAAIGALMGWSMSGARVGHGIKASMGYGLTTVALIVFWTLLVCAAQEMVERSLQMRYRTPMEALSDMVRIFIDDGRLVGQPDVLAWLFVGGLFGGIVAELSSREWS